jgi:hypothetical protein
MVVVLAGELGVQCHGEASTWQEKKTMYVEKGLLIMERGSRPTR